MTTDKDTMATMKITRVSPEAWTALRKLAIDARRPVYELVNQALVEYLDRAAPASFWQRRSRATHSSPRPKATALA